MAVAVVMLWCRPIFRTWTPLARRSQLCPRLRTERQLLLFSGAQHEVDGSHVCGPSLSLAKQQPKTHLEVHLSQQLADRDAEIRRLQEEIRALKYQS